MPTIVTSSIGTSGIYTTPAAWFAASPANYTLEVTSTTGSGSTTSAIQLNAGASSTVGAYVGNTLLIDGETRLITGYNETTKVATVGALNGSSSTFTSAPSSGVSYTIGSVVWRGELQNQDFSNAGATITFTGKVTSSTCYAELTTAPGASFIDHATASTNPLRLDSTKGATITVTGNSTPALQITQAYTRISKLQIRGTSQSSTAACPLYTNSAGTNADIDKCIVESYGRNSSLSTTARLTTAGTVIRNSIIIQRLSVDSAIALLSNGASAYNCIFAATGFTVTTGLRTASVAAVLKNCYIGNVVSPTDEVVSPTKINSFSNATSTGFSVAPYNTTTFANVTDGTHDFRLVAGSLLIDAGATEATYSATDILGTARPTGVAYDVGAHELTAAPEPAASLNWTEETDITAITGDITVSGTSGVMTWTEEADIASLSGAVATASIVTSAFKNNTGSVLANLTGLTVAVLNISGLTTVKVFTGQTTNASGVMTLVDVLLVQGSEYAVVTTNAAKTLGVEKYVAA